ncbi:hypothetical protein CSOJ01_09915 [Colletotrichum sojae]|uniref:Uncharacterized protein n=1 Tax=Colletotrichum sojae TaxID=2175907 RepID=A0A8H6J2A9_9PEZI|nr:hypothetical protein CSOJ01_09915 [Colletotrichum sojae]
MRDLRASTADEHRLVDRRDQMWSLLQDAWRIGNCESTKPFLTVFSWNKLLDVAAQFHGFHSRAALFSTTLMLDGAIVATGIIGQRGDLAKTAVAGAPPFLTRAIGWIGEQTSPPSRPGKHFVADGGRRTFSLAHVKKYYDRRLLFSADG